MSTVSNTVRRLRITENKEGNNSGARDGGRERKKRKCLDKEYEVINDRHTSFLLSSDEITGGKPAGGFSYTRSGEKLETRLVN